MTALNFERFRQDFANIVENLVGRRLDYTQLYPAVVIAQNADGTLQLLADSPTIRGTGHNNVRIRHGLPGVSVTVSQGARVRIGFENGDPSQPYAALWDTDAASVTINLTTSVDISLVAPTVNLGGASPDEFVALAEQTDDQFTKIKDMFSSWTPAPNDGGAVLKTLSSSLVFTSVAATKVKAE